MSKQKQGEGAHMEHPYPTYQTEIFKEYEYVVLCCVLCENEYKQLFNVLKMFLLFQYRTKHRGRYLIWLPFIT